jgi:hypothetical protein
MITPFHKFGTKENYILGVDLKIEASGWKIPRLED